MKRRSKAVCDGTTDPNSGPTCGRPLGVGFNNLTGQLYIADAYSGLLVVGSNGGLATPVATTAEGVPFRFLNGLDVDQLTGDVYFTDASSVYELRYYRFYSSIHESNGEKTKLKRHASSSLQGHHTGS